jgi:hypothetical protein
MTTTMQAVAPSRTTPGRRTLAELANMTRTGGVELPRRMQVRIAAEADAPAMFQSSI